MVVEILELIPKNKASHTLDFWPSACECLALAQSFLEYVIRRVSPPGETGTDIALTLKNKGPMASRRMTGELGLTTQKAEELACKHHIYFVARPFPRPDAITAPFGGSTGKVIT